MVQEAPFCFKPCYKWITFNTNTQKDLTVVNFSFMF